MLNPNDLLQYTSSLFDVPGEAEKAAEVIPAVWQARSARLSEIAREMRGSQEATSKRLHRFLSAADPGAVLWKFFDPEAEFVLGDVTEVPRPQAKRTAYVGLLKDGKTAGFDVLMLATPKRGRALPFAFVTDSSATLDAEGTSRNQEHLRALEEVRDLIGDRPLLLDREFSYAEWLGVLVEAQLRFVIRLKVGNPAVRLLDRWDVPVSLEIAPGERKVHRDVRYRGQVPVHVYGWWERGHPHPIWLVTNLEPEEALRLYPKRMKIEQSFRDEKSRLGLNRLMSRSRFQMEKVVALVLLAHAIGVWLGEALRDQLFGPPDEAQHETRRRKWHRYSGLFVWLWHGLRLHAPELRAFLRQTFPSFALLLRPPVPTHVST
jgi:hypothetical protein